MKSKELEIAKRVIKKEVEKEGLKVLKILLFGSRARGEAGEDSDWDFFVIINKKISHHHKWEIILRIKRILARENIPNDIIIKSQKEVESQKNDVGVITYYALKEGKEV